MRTCQESASYLHTIGISDGKLAEACGITRAYMCQVRNGQREGSQELAALLDTLCSQAIARGIPAKRTTKPQASLPTIVDAIPSTAIMPIPQEQAPRNRLAFSPTRGIPTIQIQPAPSRDSIQARALDSAISNAKRMLIPPTQPRLPAPTNAVVQQSTARPGTWQRIKEAYRRGIEIERQERAKHRG